MYYINVYMTGTQGSRQGKISAPSSNSIAVKYFVRTTMLTMRKFDNAITRSGFFFFFCPSFVNPVNYAAWKFRSR